jgi:hypothetical protein
MKALQAAALWAPKALNAGRAGDEVTRMAKLKGQHLALLYAG